MIHTMPPKALLTTTFEPLVMQLSNSLAQGVRLIDQFLQDDPTPQKVMTFEHELSALLREVDRRIMAWALNRLEPENDEEMPSRVHFEGHLYLRGARGFNCYLISTGSHWQAPGGGYLGQMPKSGQGTLTAQLSTLLHDPFSRVESQGVRLIYVTDESHHPRDYYHRVLKKMNRSAPPLESPGVDTDR
jgi:hypothetical protein